MRPTAEPSAGPRVREYGTDRQAVAHWVLLHGWGFDGAVMEPLAERLARDRRVLVVDLPGFGAADTDAPGIDVDRLASLVHRAVPAPAHWLGWSLGGLVALAAAHRYPRDVLGVDLLAATPRFVCAPGWPGIAAAELEAFMTKVAEDPIQAHRRFLAFQLAGSASARTVLRQLRRLTDRRGLPPATALADGLSILRRCDLRQRLGEVSCPLRATLGAVDPLVPAAVAAPLAASGLQVRVIEGAAHVPFLSHPEAVIEALDEPMAKPCP